MNYNIYIPQTDYLKTVINSIWQVEGIPPFHSETIIPKGVIEIIFDLSEESPINATINSKQVRLPKCFVNGYNTFPIYKPLPGHQIYLGIMFQPIAVKKILGIQSNEFSNIAIDLLLINKYFDTLWHQMAEQNNFNHRVSLINKWLQSKTIQISPQGQLLNSIIVSGMTNHITVKDFAREVCYSPRHLSRKIFELSSMNSEEFILYKKYLHSVHLIHQNKYSLTEIAYKSQFFDQAHFTRSFKLFADMTPSEYHQKKSTVPGHIFENVRLVQL